MAQQALSSGRPHRRVLFGLLDGDGWTWASIKATIWFVILILLLGYLPDRAYYFTVFSTIDLGVQVWTPVNLCPPENANLPCPPPSGAALPWQSAPAEINLPAAREEGALVQVGTKLLYIGGSDGTKASDQVLVAQIVNGSTFDKWQTGPKLPEARSNAAAIFLGGSVYVLGGLDGSGKPTATTYVLTPNADTGELGDWQTADAAKLPINLPAARAGAGVVAAADGLIVVGGTDGSAPTNTVWKSTLDKTAKLTAWQEGAPLPTAVTDAGVVINGSTLWVYGGTAANGPTRLVQRGDIGVSGNQANAVTRWATPQGDNNPALLPAPRTDAAAFLANGILYIVGGADSSGPKSELYWTIPDASGNIPEWKHLSQSDLPAGGLTASSVAVSGPNVFVVGGMTSSGLTPGAARTNLAPKAPFFQLGIAGVTVPALAINGEVGQQLGYINAATVGAIDFIVLVILGWAWAHKEHVAAMRQRLRNRRER
jgi:hypothetical protein